MFIVEWLRLGKRTANENSDNVHSVTVTALPSARSKVWILQTEFDEPLRQTLFRPHKPAA